MVVNKRNVQRIKRGEVDVNANDNVLLLVRKICRATV